MSSVNTIMASVDQLRATIAQLNEAQGADGVKTVLGEVDTETNSVTITVSYGSTSTEFVLSLTPDLDLPELTEAEIEASLDDFVGKLENFFGAIKAITDGETDPTGGANDIKRVYSEVATAIFDIFAMIMLLMEIAQKEREAASQVRAAEHANTQTQLEGQAKSIEDQAEFARTLGYISAGISTLGSLTALVCSGIGIGKEIKSMTRGDANVSAAKDAVTDIQDDLAKSPSQEQLSAFNKEAMEKMGFTDASDDASKNIQRFVDEKMPETKAAVDAANKAYSDVGEAQKVVDHQTDALKNANEKVGAFQNREMAQKSVDQASEDLKASQAKLDKANEAKPVDQEEVAKLQEEVKGKQADLDAAQKQLDAAKGACDKLGIKEGDTFESLQGEASKAANELQDAKGRLEKAQNAYSDALREIGDAQKRDLKTMDQRVDDAMKKLQSLKDQGKKEGDAEFDSAAKKLAELQQQRQLAEKIDQFSMMDNDQFDAYKTGIQNKLKEAQQNLAQQIDLASKDPLFNQGNALVNIGNACNALCASLTQFISTVKDYEAAKGESERKMMDVELDQSKAALEEADDLRVNAQEMFKTALAMIRDIVQELKELHNKIFG